MVATIKVPTTCLRWARRADEKESPGQGARHAQQDVSAEPEIAALQEL